MDTRETQGILAMIKAAWPNFYRDLPKTDLMAAVNLWQVQFAEYDVRLVKAAVHALIATQTEGFPPTIGAVKEQIGKLTAPHQLSEAEAWALVSRAARNGTYGYRREFEKLPPEIRRVVGRAEQLRAWAMMEADEVESVVASNFMRAYRAAVKQEKEQHALPEVVRAALPEIRTVEGGSDTDGSRLLKQ